jgi:hypothetical protein
MEYRVSVEPFDIELDDVSDIEKIIMQALLQNKISVSKITPIKKN